jgi:hypothetical protein
MRSTFGGGNNQNVYVFADWMTGGIGISGNVEGVAKYFPEDRKFRFIEVACSGAA